MYVAWAAPFQFAFLDHGEQHPFFILDNIVKAFFALDVVLTFFVAYTDTKQIALRYLKSGFLLDVLSSIPHQVAAMIIPRYPTLLDMLRLWRITMARDLFARLEEVTNLSYFWVRIIKLIIVSFSVFHYAGCFYYKLAASYHDPKKTWIGATMDNFLEQNMWTCYVKSIYWSMSTVFGSGDLPAQNMREQIFVTVYMYICIGLGAYLSGNFTILLVQGTNQTTTLRSTIQDVSSIAQRNQLPTPAENQMISRLALIKKKPDVPEILDIFHPPSKSTKSSIMHIPFDKAYLLRGVSSDFLLQLVSEMEIEHFLSRKDVILQNDEPTDFYLLVTGAVDLLIVRNGTEQVNLHCIISGDMGKFACTAAEQNSLGMLKDMVYYDGDVTLSRNDDGTTALHVAVSNRNVDVVKFLLEQGAVTPRHLANMEGREDIQTLFLNQVAIQKKDKPVIEDHLSSKIREPEIPYRKMFKGECSTSPLNPKNGDHIILVNDD